MFTRRISDSLFPLLLAIVVLTGAIATAAAQASSAETVIPLEGLDPVMLSQGKEVQGDMKHKVTRGKFEYLFANAENKAVFEKDPARYEIQVNGHCARMGAPTSGNPDLYLVHNGRIYVFGSEECQTLFKATPEKYLEVPTPKSQPTEKMIKRGNELISKAIEVMGAEAKLKTLQKTELRGNQVKSVLTVVFPDSLRQEVIRSNFTLASVVTPSESFVVVNNLARPLPEDNRTALFNDLYRDPIFLLRASTQPDFKVWLSANDSEEKTLAHLDIELPEFNTSLGLDPQTGRVMNQSFVGRGPGGVVGKIVINYSDFRTVEGLVLPFKSTATFDGQPFPALSGTIEAITINGQVDPSSFKKPQARK